MRPPWLTEDLLNAVRARWPIGRNRLRRELGLTDHKARTLIDIIAERAAVDKCAAEVLLPHLSTTPRTVEELAETVDRAPGTVSAWLRVLQRLGYPVSETAPGRYVLDRDPPPAESKHTLDVSSGSTIRIGFVSDTHLGSMYQQITYLHMCYEWFSSEGVKDVYHAGDLLDGIGVYRGQHTEIFLHTYQDQIEYAVDRYPKYKDIRTYMIGGNHDMASIRAGGIDPIRAVAAKRPDIVPLGAYSAWILIGGVLQLYLLHPDGGSSYAISYKLQKIIESFEGGRKPHILVAGHWHQRTYVDARNVDAYMPGCFQYQTPYETRKALQPRLGALMLDIAIGDIPGDFTVRQTFRKFLKPKEKDW